MPTSTIPYDPSLVLGMIVDPQKIKDLEKIASLQKPVDAERDHFNALLRQKLSLDMTMRELISLGATPDQVKDLKTQIGQLMTDLTKVAVSLAKKVKTAEAAIAKTKSAQGQKQIGSQLQSPIDFAASQLQSMPLSSDTMNMDVQYFRYEDNEQASRSTASSISTFVGAKVTSLLGPSYGASAGASAHQTSTAAYDNHGIFGTLVICANCTSRDVQMFSPLKLDPDAAVESYVFSGKGSMPVEDIEEMKRLALAKISLEDRAKGIPVIVGESYGSSFVGFVHFEKLEETSSSQSTESVAAQARVEAEADLFLRSISGSFGMDAQSANSLKQLLSTSDIQSHCALITMGLIPSIKSNNVTTAVKELKGSVQERMAELAAMQDASNSGIMSVASGGASAKKGQSLQQMSSAYIKSSVEAVGEMDKSNNQVIDLNSLMTAFDDYVAKAGDGKTGVPINFYLKYVTQRDIAMEWMQKYYPTELHEKVKKNGDG